MKPPQAYKILISDGTIHPKDPLSFKMVTSSSERTAKPFTFPSRNQHFNSQFFIFESNKKVTLQFICSTPLKPAEILLDKSKQVVDLIDKEGHNQGAVTVEVQNIKTYPHQKFKFYAKGLRAEFTLGMAPKKEIFLLIKHGDKHFQTEIREWKQQHEIDPEETHLNIYIECWAADDQYVGVATVPIGDSMNMLTRHALKDMKDIEIGTISLQLLDEERFREDAEKSGLEMRPLKIYILEAVLNNQMKDKIQTYVNVELEGSDNKLSTTSVFSSERNPKWNQSFQVVIREEEFIKFELCEREEQQDQVLAAAKIFTEDLQDGKLELNLESSGNQVGKLYIELESRQIKRQQHKSPPSKTHQLLDSQKTEKPDFKSMYKEPTKQHTYNKLRQTKLGSPQTIQKLKQMKAKYTGKTLYEYYNQELNEALREGLMVVAKEKPADPIRQLGLFLINYKK